MPRSLPDVVDQHAEEAAFLWLVRTEATRAPNYTLDDLAALDERVAAHLDGLRVAGDHGWHACRDALHWRESGEVFAAAHVALQRPERRRVWQVLDVATESVELGRGFVSALGWFPYPHVQPYVETILRSEDPAARRIGIAGAAVHRRDPGERLVEAARDREPTVRWRAAKAAAELGRSDLLPYCHEDLADPAVDARFWGGWSAALLGDDGATRALWHIAAGGGPLAERACDLAVRRTRHPKALEWQQGLARLDEYHHLAIVAARALGDPVAVPWLLDAMTVNELARPAGEAFGFITGLDLADANLDRRRPDGFPAGPTEDPDDEDVAMDPDEDLPWPDPHAVSRWWSGHRERFTAGTRYLMGRPIAHETLGGVLRWGTQRQRAAAAIELVLLRPGRPLFEVRAPGGRQQSALAS